MKAGDLPRHLMEQLTRADDTRVFRNNTGMGWAGQLVSKGPNGFVALRNARPLHAGLVEGSSDLIGWHTVTIRPEHVGARLAVFVALEAKHGVGRLTPEQRNFIDVVRRAGGIAGEVRDVESALKLINF